MSKSYLFQSFDQMIKTSLNYRTIVTEHIPKRHLNFEDPILTDKVFDNTSNRIIGERSYPMMGTEASTLGKGFNPADNLARVGRKQEIMEADVSDLSIDCHSILS